MKRLLIRPRSVTLNVGKSHVYVHALKPRRDSDGLPMRQIEVEIYLGNLMILQSFTFSKVRR